MKEFKTYIKKDRQILQCLTSFGLATSDDMGTDFGNDTAGVPLLDEDLENEINPPGRK